MFQFITNGDICSAKGYKAAGIHCGIKKKKRDLALIYSDYSCTAAGTFTLNKVKAAPIIISKKLVEKKVNVRAVLVNSGNANACTGEQGHENALLIQEHAAKCLDLNPEEVLISSTGVIGQQMPMDKIINGVTSISKYLSYAGGFEAAEAIMTTDLRMKTDAVLVKLSKGEVVIGGICKGSGMIMPNMATMLAFLTTDAAIDQPMLQSMLMKAVKKTFNKISVDGDTSTNDMVVLLSNGAAGISLNNIHDEQLFQEALDAICLNLARAIVVDGEGATKLVSISVKNAKTDEDADIIAKSIANSPLVKTALNGCDANWGRIISAAGKSGVDFCSERVKIYFDDLPVLLHNYNIVLDEEKAKAILSKDELAISFEMEEGNCSSTWWTCDFSQEYIKINANYRT